MKNLLILVSLTIALISTSGCSSNSPKAASDKFLTHFYHMEFDEAKKLSTEDTKKILDMYQQLEQFTPDSDKVQLKKVKVEVKDAKEEGDKATVTYTTSDNPKEQTLHLVKQGGKWLVQLSKSDINSGTNDQATDGASNMNDSTSIAPTSAGDTSTSDSGTAK